MNTKFILLVTHADDELVNMAHFLLKEESSCILVTGNEPDRRKKFIKVMKDFNKEYYYLPFTPGYLLSYDRDWVYYNIRERVVTSKNKHDEKTKKEYNELWPLSTYETIVSKVRLVIPSTFDTHPEHLLVSAMGCRIVGEHPVEIPGVLSTCRGTEKRRVEVPDKLNLLTKYYPEETKDLTKTLDLTRWEYHSGY